MELGYRRARAHKPGPRSGARPARGCRAGRLRCHVTNREGAAAWSAATRAGAEGGAAETLRRARDPWGTLLRKGTELVHEPWWRGEVRPEWAGHTWRALEASAPTELVGQARVWADAPVGVLYIHAAAIRDAYAFAVAVSQRAGRTIRDNHPPHDDGPLAVGLLDELCVPQDPDPDHTERTRRQHPKYAAVDTRESFLYEYAQRLGGAPLALLRLPPAADPDGVLDQIADRRSSAQLPTLVASVIPPNQVTSAYGARIAWRLGLAEADDSVIGLKTSDAAVLDLASPPR